MRQSPARRSSLFGYLDPANGARDDVRASILLGSLHPASWAWDDISATMPPDVGDTSSAPSEDFFGMGLSPIRRSNPGKGHDVVSSPKRYPSERAARVCSRAPAQSV